MHTEITALEENNTWKVVPLPPGKTIIGCKSVYKIKYLIDGSTERFKSKLVAKGFNQRKGLDYQETISPVVKILIIRSVLALGSSLK